ncbi:MAG: GNAT family N-acetyltransferase [Planctomycetes bacterium]|jgi:RimJ/RimL family protein N-acetyltransferase|nr:GNAT family N-acetyltransferase [Planctomycetota bacterium]
MESNSKRVPFIKGEKIDLVILDPERHLFTGQAMLTNPEINRYLNPEVFNFPLTLTSERKWFESKDGNKNEIVLAIETKAGEHIGGIGLHNIDWLNRRAILGIYIGRPEFWNQGIATEAETLIIRHGFNIGLHKILADVYEPNGASAHVAEKNGFRLVGVYKKHVFKNGEWFNDKVYELLREDWVK